MVEWIFLDRCVLMIIFVFSRQYLQKNRMAKIGNFIREYFLMISYCKLKILPKKSEVPNIGNFDRWYFLMISYCKLKVLVREYFLMISFENTRIKENPFFGLLPNPPQNNGWVDFPWHYMTGSPLLWIFLDEPGGLTLPPLRWTPLWFDPENSLARSPVLAVLLITKRHQKAKTPD